MSITESYEIVSCLRDPISWRKHTNAHHTSCPGKA